LHTGLPSRDNIIPCIGTDSLMYQAETLDGSIWDKQVGWEPGLGTSLAAIVIGP
jgi:hypothetical protein